jgi:hypothetical protein
MNPIQIQNADVKPEAVQLARPVDTFGCLVVTNLVGGALRQFFNVLIERTALKKWELAECLVDFNDATGLAFDTVDPRFWESSLAGIQSLRQRQAQPGYISNMIEQTLPPYQEGRDRKVSFEPDGSIVYLREDGDWELPRDIDGYHRDPNNAYRFIPLWQPCKWRLAQGTRTPSCGCINVLLQCTHPSVNKAVRYTDCEHCSSRGV